MEEEKNPLQQLMDDLDSQIAFEQKMASEYQGRADGLRRAKDMFVKFLENLEKKKQAELSAIANKIIDGLKKDLKNQTSAPEPFDGAYSSPEGDSVKSGPKVS